MASALLHLNKWTHVAATSNGSTQRLYANGVQVASRSQTGSASASSNPFRIGGSVIRREYFAGSIDEVRIYNRALTATEIQADMKTPVQ
jgi:Concanavalin A-like lectin/glucanases superfamily